MRIQLVANNIAWISLRLVRLKKTVPEPDKVSLIPALREMITLLTHDLDAFSAHQCRLTAEQPQILHHINQKRNWIPGYDT